MKNKAVHNNVDCINIKNKLLKEISFFKNTLVIDNPVSSNRPIAFSNNKEYKINTNEYFEFSPTKDSRQKGLVNANYLKLFRDKQQVSSVVPNKHYFRNNDNLNKTEKEDSFDIFMKDFKVDKNVKNQFIEKFKNSQK